MRSRSPSTSSVGAGGGEAAAIGVAGGEIDAGHFDRAHELLRQATQAQIAAAQETGCRRGDGIAGYLYDQAMKDNPSPFMTGLAKLLPLLLEGSKDAPIIVERVIICADDE